MIKNQSIHIRITKLGGHKPHGPITAPGTGNTKTPYKLKKDRTPAPTAGIRIYRPINTMSNKTMTRPTANHGKPLQRDKYIWQSLSSRTAHQDQTSKVVKTITTGNTSRPYREATPSDPIWPCTAPTCHSLQRQQSKLGKPI